MVKNNYVTFYAGECRTVRAWVNRRPNTIRGTWRVIWDSGYPYKQGKITAAVIEIGKTKLKSLA